MAGLDKPIYGAPAAGETVEDVLARIAPRDMVVLFALGGIRSDMADLCERARKLGAKLICITDTASHAPPSDWLLRCHTTPHAAEVRHLTDTSAAQALAYGLAAHTIQWGAIPFELI